MRPLGDKPRRNCVPGHGGWCAVCFPELKNRKGRARRGDRMHEVLKTAERDHGSPPSLRGPVVG